jgi:F-type H+-transporting ATPase subunit delta
VARRYASALFNAAAATGLSEAVEREMALVMDLWNQAAGLRSALVSPLVPTERKKAVLAAALGADVSAVTKSFLGLLVDKRREEVLPAAYEEYCRQADEARGLVRAKVSVASPLPTEQERALQAALEQRTGKRVEMETSVEPGILGGVVVRMGDTILDGSVRGSLERLRERLLAAEGL